jgi:hypothetical protein
MEISQGPRYLHLGPQHRLLVMAVYVVVKYTNGLTCFCISQPGLFY